MIFSPITGMPMGEGGQLPKGCGIMLLVATIVVTYAIITPSPEPHLPDTPIPENNAPDTTHTSSVIPPDFNISPTIPKRSDPLREAYNRGYEAGYKQGREVGWTGERRGLDYWADNDYTGELAEDYRDGYHHGYDEGYDAGYGDYRDKMEKY